MNASREKAWILLGLLISIDLLFVCLHLIHVNTHMLLSPRFELDRDRGFAEFFQYSKESWLALVMLILGNKTKERLYHFWVIFFAFLLLDDALQIHERVGEVIQHVLHFVPMFHLRAQDLGELTVYALSGIFFLIWLGRTYFLSSPVARRESLQIAFPVGLLLFFGVVVDQFHSMLAEFSWSPTLGLVEDGGEMVALSIICMVVYSIVTAKDLQGFLNLDWLLAPLQHKHNDTPTDMEGDTVRSA